ncbi:MAG TPA: glutathione S-transferase family protein [Rhizomicrobium sp.]|nr:glutathione S-transferase family protein [Rhizomicrobium sp.]
MPVLYEHVLSPYAQKIKIALREKGVSFQVAMPGGIGSGATDGEFAEGSPRGEVPLLVDDDVRVFDSTIILEYIEDNWPTPPLLPHGAADRARVRMLEEVMDTHYEAINWAMGEVSWFQRATGEAAERLRNTAREQTAGFHGWLERQLGDRDWFNGSHFGWGDLSVVPYLNGSRGHGQLVPEGTKLAKWMERVNARPSVAATTKDITDMLSGGGMQMTDVAKMVEQGLFKREYRDHRLEWMIKVGGIDVITKGLEKDNIRFGPEFG